jgi:hypothetical protein
MNTINERIQAVINHLKITPYEFSKKMGNDRPEPVYRFLKDHSIQISTKSLEKIRINFPEINYHWLLTGDGDMLAELPLKKVNVNKDFIDELFDSSYFLEKLRFQISKKDISDDDLRQKITEMIEDIENVPKKKK